MKDHEKLLAAIRAAPDDDAPRLVLADRLIELGDSRGELIHVQCVLARLAADDAKRAELVAHETALLAKQKRPRGTTVTYDRGFVVAATVESHLARDAIAFLLAEPLLSQLTVDGCGGGGSERWSMIGSLVVALMGQLTRLELEGVIWYWYDADWDDTGRIEREEMDESGECADMLARLPPRPSSLVELSIPARVRLPASWQR